jgi:hypothetical protein
VAAEWNSWRGKYLDMMGPEPGHVPRGLLMSCVEAHCAP